MAMNKRRGGSGSTPSPRGGLNFRPSFGQQESRGAGTRPTAPPASVALVVVLMFIHLCKKSLLFDPRLKVPIYLGAIFFISVVTDAIVMPKSYFSRSDNVFNKYFVKWGWGWLLVVTIPWVSITAQTICCGRRSHIVKHLLRLVIATTFWLFWTKFFVYIENIYGRCLNSKDITFQNKTSCLKAGKFWSGLDISGHTFILIYSSLILAEEGIAILGWESISDLVMNEEHTRQKSTEISTGPLRSLSDGDLGFLKKAHKTFTPYLRALFVAMTIQQLLCDVMLVTTLLYYHIMVEKFLGGVCAVLTWYATYHWLYKQSDLGLKPPADGLFKYSEARTYRDKAATRIRRNTLNGENKFMGMPIRTDNTRDTGFPNRQNDDSLSSPLRS